MITLPVVMRVDQYPTLLLSQRGWLRKTSATALRNGEAASRGHRRRRALGLAVSAGLRGRCLGFGFACQTEVECCFEAVKQPGVVIGGIVSEFSGGSGARFPGRQARRAF